MPIVDESKQNKGVNNNTRNKQMAIDMEYYNRLNHLRFKSPYLGAKYQYRVIPVRTLNGVQDVFVDNRGTIKQGGHTHSKLYNYSNKNRTHPIKGAYVREVDSWNNNTSPIEDIVYNMHKASPKKRAGVLSYISTGVVTIPMLLKHILDFRKQLKVMI